MLKQLHTERKKLRDVSDELVLEAHRILTNENFSEKNILSNLKQYNQSFELLNEEGIDTVNLYTPQEIKNFCIHYRYRFVNSQNYLGEYPYESVLKTKDLNNAQRKDLRHFKILCRYELLKDKKHQSPAALFCKTMYGNYYLIHQWGGSLTEKRKVLNWPLRNFETIFISTIIVAAIIAIILPNNLLSTDTHVGYFSMYRAAGFFHVLILLVGFVVFRMIATNKGLSSSNWDSAKL